MPEGMNPDERRAFREGAMEAKVTEHAAHLARLNGSMDENSQAIRELEKSTAIGFANNARELSGIGDHLIGIEMQMPKLQTVAQEQETAIRVAAALAKKTKDEETRWEHWRSTVAWTTGLLGFGLVIANFVMQHWGI